MAYSGAYRNGGQREETEAADVPARPGREPRPAGRGRAPLPFDLGALLKKTEAAGMETDDLLMALILFLMYRESGDIDLLIMLGVMLLT